MLLCEICGDELGIGYCEQCEPVERVLCYRCAEENQRATHPHRWRGIYHPTDEELGLS